MVKKTTKFTNFIYIAPIISNAALHERYTERLFLRFQYLPLCKADSKHVPCIYSHLHIGEPNLMSAFFQNYLYFIYNIIKSMYTKPIIIKEKHAKITLKSYHLTTMLNLVCQVP